jgi:dTDP-4-amino-4,6-dideoxygalactose transaminase
MVLSVRTGAPPAPPLPLVPLQRPQPPAAEEILAYYARSEAEGFYANGGPCARLLAQRLEEDLGGGVVCVPVGNATVGLMAALRAACGAPHPTRPLVLTPSYTFTATACAIRWAGFEPAFVDVDADGWHLDPAALAEALHAFRGRVAGVLACATFGTAPVRRQRAAWRAACAEYGVPLLVDSAPGFGATDEHGAPLGAMGETEVFSFHATKPFAVGEGGLVVTPDVELAARIGRLINFGLEPGTRESGEAGLNGKLPELLAATALAMRDAFPAVLRARRRTAARLRGELAGTGVRYQLGAARSTWQVLPVLAPDATARAAIVDAAPAHGVQVRTMHDPPLHRHPAFSACRRRELPATEALAARSLSLPMANDLSEEEIARIAALVRSGCA